MTKGSRSSTAAALEVDEPSRSGPPPAYTDLAKLRNAEGLVAIISRRRSTGVITFAVMKEFERDGRVENTSFVPENLHGSYVDLLNLVGEWIAKFHRGEVPADTANGKARR
jgi:hypothetical protein